MYTGTYLKIRRDDLKTELILMCESDDYTYINICISHHVNINQQDIHGYTALRYGILYNNREYIRILLRLPHINTSIYDTQGRTPLMLACHMNALHIVEDLIYIGSVDMYICDSEGRCIWYYVTTDACRKIIGENLGKYVLK